MFKALLKKQLKEIGLIYTSGGRRKSSAGGKRRGLGKNGLMEAAPAPAAQNSGSKIGYILLYSMVAVSMFFAFLGVSDALSSVLLGMVEGVEWIYFALVSVMALAFGMIGSVFSIFSSIYKSKDNELLLSMPIKPWMIVCVRMISCWLIAFVCVAVGLAPAMLKYGQYRSVSGGQIAMWVVLVFSTSFLCMALSCLLGWIVALISRKLKNKSITTVLITVVLLAGYYVFYFNANNLLTKLVANAVTIGVKIEKNIYPLYAAGRAFVCDGKCFAFTVAISLAAFALVYLFISKSFIKIVTASDGTKKVAYKASAVTSSSIPKTLLKRELKHFASSPAYMLNCGLGVLFMLAAAVMLIIKRSDIDGLMMLLEQNLPSARTFIPLALIIISSFFTATNDITSPSISIEGENYWILKSLPVDLKEVIYAKVKMHVLVNVVPLAVMLAVACVILRLDALSIAAVVLVSLLSVVLQALAGIAVNIKMPKFDWVNETVCVKQSGSVVTVLFGGWLIIAGEGLLYWFLLQDIVGPAAYIIILAAVKLAASIVLKYWLDRKGSNILSTL